MESKLNATSLFVPVEAAQCSLDPLVLAVNPQDKMIEFEIAKDPPKERTRLSYHPGHNNLHNERSDLLHIFDGF